jgi:hypothetical protein
VSIGFILFQDTEPQRPSVGSCIADTGKGVEVVGCESDEAEQRLVTQDGTNFDVTEIECPEGAEAIGLQSPGDSVTLRWCAEPV